MRWLLSRAHSTKVKFILNCSLRMGNSIEFPLLKSFAAQGNSPAAASANQTNQKKFNFFCLLMAGCAAVPAEISGIDWLRLAFFDLWVMAAAAAMLRKEKTSQASNQFKDFSSFLWDGMKWNPTKKWKGLVGGSLSFVGYGRLLAALLRKRERTAANNQPAKQTQSFNQHFSSFLQQSISSTNFVDEWSSSWRNWKEKLVDWLPPLLRKEKTNFSSLLVQLNLIDSLIAPQVKGSNQLNSINFLLFLNWWVIGRRPIAEQQLHSNNSILHCFHFMLLLHQFI